MTLLPNSVSLEENLHDVDAVSLAAHQANDASTEEQDGSVWAKATRSAFYPFIVLEELPVPALLMGRPPPLSKQPPLLPMIKKKSSLQSTRGNHITS